MDRGGDGGGDKGGGGGEADRQVVKPTAAHSPGVLLTTLYLPTSCLNSPCNFERLPGVGAAPWNLKPGSRRSMTAGAHPGQPGEHSRGSQTEDAHSRGQAAGEGAPEARQSPSPHLRTLRHAGRPLRLHLVGNQPTQLLPGPPFPPLQMRVIKLTCNDGGDENMNTERSTISSRRARLPASTPSSRLCAPRPCTELPARGSDSRLPASSRFRLTRTPGLCVLVACFEQQRLEAWSRGPNIRNKVSAVGLRPQRSTRWRTSSNNSTPVPGY